MKLVNFSSAVILKYGRWNRLLYFRGRGKGGREGGREGRRETNLSLVTRDSTASSNSSSLLEYDLAGILSLLARLFLCGEVFASILSKLELDDIWEAWAAGRNENRYGAEIRLDSKSKRVKN